MFGLILAVIWLGVMGLAALKFDQSGTHVKTASGATVDVPVHVTVTRLPVLILAVGLTPFWFVFGNHCFLTIPPAHVAAIYDPLRGGIQQGAMPEGFHMILPWWDTQQFSAQTQEYTLSGSSQGAVQREGGVVGEGSIRCQTNEGMTVDVDCTVLYHVDPKDASDVWQKLGDDEVKLIVRPYTHNVIRMVVSKYSVVDIYTSKRKEMEDEITTTMRPLFQEKGLILEQILIRNVAYGNPQFADAINAKQVAQQQVQTEGQKLNRAKIEKQTIVAEAQGEAAAISRRGATLRENPEVVQYEYVQKVAPQIRTMYLPAGSLPILGGGR